VVLADGRTVRRIEEGQTVPHEKPRDAHAEAVQFMQRPDWWRKPAPVEPQLAMPLAPSRLAPLETDEDGELREPRRIEPLEPAQPPASTVIDQKRFLRGTLTHALLEHLPGLPSASWSEAAATYLDVRASDLSVGIRRSIASETLKVLEDPQFAHLFGPQSQAEVPVVAVIERPKGKGPPLRVTGQIDRLVRHGNQVTIVDYKTNRPPPMEASAVAEAYLYQLAAYRLVLRRIFTGSSVSAVIFWTDGPRLMPISDHILDTYAEKLWTLDSGRLDGR
jgi:ATP-dependent helicase/nuclease subunit A